MAIEVALPWVARGERRHAAAAATPSHRSPSPRPSPRTTKCGAARRPENALVRRDGRAGPRTPRTTYAGARRRGASSSGGGARDLWRRGRRRAQDPLWYKDAVLYETHVRSFYDSNDDGIGDLRGLVQKLDYLQDLGVTCLWLLPLFPSPLRDDGYDIADYKAIHPDYGTLDDFRELVAAAHARGIRILVELVVNHTSDQHPWFQRARRAPPGSPERDYYVWSDTDERYKDARIIFTDTEKSNWTWDPEAKQYYWHRFFSHQPDLNFENPAVLQEMLDVARLLGGARRRRLPARRGAVPRRGGRDELREPPRHARRS